MSLYQTGDFKRALDLIESVAGQDLDIVQFNCGLMYDYGKGAEPNKKKSLFGFEKITEQGEEKANIFL